MRSSTVILGGKGAAVGAAPLFLDSVVSSVFSS